jgi:hypothetical protein
MDRPLEHEDAAMRLCTLRKTKRQLTRMEPEMIRKTIIVVAMAASAAITFAPASAQTAQQKEQALNRAREANSEAHVDAYQHRNDRAKQQDSYAAREANSRAHVYAYQHRNDRAQKQNFYRAREENSQDHVEAYQNRNDSPQQRANAARQENSQDHVDAYNNRPH